MATETHLWQKVYLSRWSKVYLDAGKIIGHLGCRGTEFFDEAKLLPCYDKLSFENAIRDLTVYMKREKGEYELHATAKKILKVILGPSPDAPEYRNWWEARLVSVRLMKELGQPVEWAESPPGPAGAARRAQGEEAEGEEGQEGVAGGFSRGGTEAPLPRRPAVHTLPAVQAPAAPREFRGPV